MLRPSRLIYIGFGGAGVALLVGLGFFFAPFGVSTNLAGRGTAAAALVSGFAVVLSALALAITVRVESSDFRAEERVKEDIARLLASLRGIYLKSAWLTQQADQDAPRHASLFDRERQVVQDFLSSTTAPALYALEGRASLTAGRQPEEWRVFSLYLLEIIGSDVPKQYRLVANRAVRAERLLTGLRRDQIAALSADVADLPRAIEQFAMHRENTVLAKIAYKVFGGADEAEGDHGSAIAELQDFKRKGIVDPDVDLWIALDGDDAGAVQSAVKAGADLGVTLQTVLRRHRDTPDTNGGGDEPIKGDNMPSKEALLAKFRQIKARGVDDPDVDMFIAVLEGDGSIDALKDALARGADPNISDTQLLQRYE